MNRKFTSTITGASVFITLTGILSKGLGFIREVVFAGFFGLSTQFDIYLVGAVLPITLNTAILYLCQNYLIPAANNTREREPGKYNSFLQANFTLFIYGGLLLALVMFVFSGSIVSFYMKESSAPDVVTAVNVFRIFILSVPFNCIIAVLTAYHQLNFEFRYPAYSQLLLNVIIIILVIIFTRALGIYSIPSGYTAGSVLQMVYLLFKYKPDWKVTFAIHLRGISKYLPPALLTIIIIETIGQLYILVDRYFYIYVPAGGIAALSYAQTIFLLPVSLFSMAMATAIFPYFSKFFSKRMIPELENIYNQSLSIITALFIAASVVFIFYGSVIIKLFYERGRFSPEATSVTYHVLIFFSAGLVFYAVYSVINKLMFSCGFLRPLLFITIGGITVKIIASIFLVKVMEQDGLALATSLSYFFFFGASIIVVYSKIKFTGKSHFAKEFVFGVFNAGFSLLIAKVIFSAAPGNTFLPFEAVVFCLVYSLNFNITDHNSKQYFTRILKLSKINYYEK